MGLGRDLGFNENHPAHKMHVVVTEDLKWCCGMYPNKEMADNLARGMEKRDREILDKEMDKVLLSK